MKSLLIVFLLFISFGVAGQELIQRGIVTDETGTPIQGVNVSLLSDKQKGTSSGTDGSFSIDCKQGDTLFLSHISFDPRIIPINGENPLPPLILRLYPRLIALEQVTITGKRDKSFRYLLDFEIVQGNILRLEIKGRNKLLILTDLEFSEFWRCLLPEHLLNCKSLSRDFLGNAYLQSDDSLYQLKLDTRECMILPAVTQTLFHQIMDPCVGKTTNSIIVKKFGEYNKSISLWLVKKTERKKIYAQEDKLGLLFIKDIAGNGPKKAGLGFEVMNAEMKAPPPASLYNQHIPRGASSDFCNRILAKPISVEAFCINDSIYIFDNIANKMFVFNQQGELLNSYQQGFSKNDFTEKYVLDDYTKNIYGVYKDKQGIYLQPIDRNSGVAKGQAKWIEQRFYEKVRIVENTAYYLKYDHLANTRKLISTQL